MKLRFISLSISTLVIFSFIIFNIIRRKEINSINHRQKEILIPFLYISNKYIDILSKLLSTKLVIAIKNLYGEENLKENLIILISKKLFSSFILINIVLILFSYINQEVVLIGGIFFVIIYSFLLDTKIMNDYKMQNKKFKNDLPNFITRLSLLINLGISLRTAIGFIAQNSDGEVVDKFNKVKKLIDNGMSEEEAYNTILVKTNDILIRKFISNLMQNIKTGGDDLEEKLELIKKETNDYRKSQMIFKAQEANRKLLIPNLFIFLGIMLMVMVPVLLSIL